MIWNAHSIIPLRNLIILYIFNCWGRFCSLRLRLSIRSRSLRGRTDILPHRLRGRMDNLTHRLHGHMDNLTRKGMIEWHSSYKLSWSTAESFDVDHSSLYEECINEYDAQKVSKNIPKLFGYFTFQNSIIELPEAKLTLYVSSH